MPSELAPEPEPAATGAPDSEVQTGVEEAAETDETAPKRPVKLKPLFGPKSAAKPDSPPKVARDALKSKGGRIGRCAGLGAATRANGATEYSPG